MDKDSKLLLVMVILISLYSQLVNMTFNLTNLKYQF